jgi:hypothetical protein
VSGKLSPTAMSDSIGWTSEYRVTIAVQPDDWLLSAVIIWLQCLRWV